jgi:hypothetical protein
MLKNTISLLAILILFTDLKCVKSNLSAPDTLPPITQQGLNTFGCLVNGKVWVPFYPCDLAGPDAVALSYDITPLYTYAALPILFSMMIGNASGDHSYFNIRQNYSLSDHIYGPGNIIDSILISYVGSPGVIYYPYNYNYPGQAFPRYFQITKLDTVNKIVSGIFAFTLYAPVGAGRQFQLDSLVISQGRFDLQFGRFLNCSH